jgi:hypothetical protein
MTQPTLEEILDGSQEGARKQLTRMTPQLASLIAEVEQWLMGEATISSLWPLSKPSIQKAHGAQKPPSGISSTGQEKTAQKSAGHSLASMEPWADGRPTA